MPGNVVSPVTEYISAGEAELFESVPALTPQTRPEFTEPPEIRVMVEH